MAGAVSEAIQTSHGRVRGELSADAKVLAFRGIPYAAAPTGDLRWRPPQPPDAWTGERDCRRFGPVAIQPPMPADSIFAMTAEAQSEDCLRLNVWTAAKVADEQLPVIVWLHPGAYLLGSGSSPLYDGESWARAGAVLVSLNYRLSQLGFLAHPELSDENPEGICGNYGLLDQIAALRWVRDNIDKFGGDPGCVTIYGVSSGASSASLLMSSPRARGLFHRAIGESGGSFGPLGETAGLGDQWQTLKAAIRSGEVWAKQLRAPRLADLRALDADTIRAATARFRSSSREIFDAARPIVDGSVVPKGSRQVFEQGLQADVPLLVGSAANERLAIASAVVDFATYLRQARDDHGVDTEEFLALYPAADDREAVLAALQASGHRLFTWQNWIWARLHARRGNPVYYYQFELIPPVPEGRYVEQQHARSLGAFHAASIFYTFRHFRTGWNWRSVDHELSAVMVAAWVTFARTGRPTASGLPDWERFKPEEPKVMALGARPCMRDVLELAHIRFWDRYYDVRSASS